MIDTVNIKHISIAEANGDLSKYGVCRMKNWLPRRTQITRNCNANISIVVPKICLYLNQHDIESLIPIPK